LQSTCKKWQVSRFSYKVAKGSTKENNNLNRYELFVPEAARNIGANHKCSVNEWHIKAAFFGFYY